MGIKQLPEHDVKRRLSSLMILSRCLTQIITLNNIVLNTSPTIPVVRRILGILNGPVNREKNWFKGKYYWFDFHWIQSINVCTHIYHIQYYTRVTPNHLQVMNLFETRIDLLAACPVRSIVYTAVTRNFNYHYNNGKTI